MTTSKPSAIPDERISSKLLKRLNNFTRTTSKESTQTLAKWILFHARHHDASLQNTLVSFLLAQPKPVEPRILNLVFWNLLSEICTMYSDGVEKKDGETKWKTYSDFRLGVCERVLLPAMKALSSLEGGKGNIQQVKTSVKNMIGSWDTKKSFGNTACIDDLRDALDASSTTDETAQEDSKKGNDESSEIHVDTKPDEALEDAPDEVKESEQVSTPVPSDDDDFGGFGDGDVADEIDVTPQPMEVQKKAQTPETETPKKDKKVPASSPASSSRKRLSMNKTSSFSTMKIDFESKVSKLFAFLLFW